MDVRSRPSAPQVLISRRRIAARVRALGRDIAAAMSDGPGRPRILALLDGSFCFVADLMRAVPLPDLRISFARASSYGSGQESRGDVDLDPMPDLRGADLLIVDDILDTGRTLAAAVVAATAAGAARVRTCVLLDKPARRILPISADHVGFIIPDRFVIGYGLDHDGAHRHLRDLCCLGDSSPAPAAPSSPAGQCLPCPDRPDADPPRPDTAPWGRRSWPSFP